MFRIVTIAFAAIAFALVSVAQEPESEPDAQQLLDDVVIQLPREPLEISGDIILRKRRGVVVNELSFQMKLDYGALPATAIYTICDKFGREVEQLKVTRAHGREAEFKYYSGQGHTEAPVPDLFSAVQATDVTWMDLTLSFLWWPGGRITGMESVKGRTCYQVEIPAPTGWKGSYTRIVLSIDKSLHMLLRAEALDAAGKSVRVLWVKSIKKINDRWMLKDLEVQSGPNRRTKLVVREVNGEKTGLSEGPGEEETGAIFNVPVQQE